MIRYALLLLIIIIIILLEPNDQVRAARRPRTPRHRRAAVEARARAHRCAPRSRGYTAMRRARVSGEISGEGSGDVGGDVSGDVSG